MNGPSKWCLLMALLLLASGCSSGRASKRSDPSLEARAEELEERNRALREQIRQKEAQIEQAFASATQAENAAGLQGLGCAAVMPAKAAPKGMPRSGVSKRDGSTEGMLRDEMNKRALRTPLNFDLAIAGSSAVPRRLMVTGTHVVVTYAQ